MNSFSKSTMPLLLTVFASGTVLGMLLGRRKKKMNPEEHLWSIVANSFTGALLYAGDALELYDYLEAMGRPVTAKELATTTGWSERWLVEFLSQAAGAGICSFDPVKERFALQPGYASMLCNPATHPKSMAGMFEFLLPLLKRAETVLVPAIRSGKGVDYDFANPQIVRAIDRKKSNWFRLNMIKDVIEDVVIPSTGKPLVDMLERGVNIADVGCGCGASSLVLAKRFPNSTIYAYETSTMSLDILEKRIRDDKVKNIVVCNVAKRSVGDGPNDKDGLFSFVYCNDLLHDMTDPQSLMKEVKGKLTKDGCWVVVDIKCADSLAENIGSPSAASLFGFSCLLCLACSTSEENGIGLGTCGLSPSRCRALMAEAGFTSVEERSVASNPLNTRYIVT